MCHATTVQNSSATSHGTNSGHRQRQAEDGEVEDEVAKADAHRRPRVAAEQAEARRQVVAEAAEVAHLARLLRLQVQRARLAVRGQHRLQPAADVAAARYGRHVVEPFEETQPLQTLQDAEPERRAADAAAGQRQPDQRLVEGLADTGAFVGVDSGRGDGAIGGVLTRIGRHAAVA